MQRRSTTTGTRSSLSGWVPKTEAERTAVRDQLERMLASHLLRTSKRYPSFLRFVVERALEGRSDQLKERTLGVEVFGREPHYDTNLDPVVRATAGEIRKRIAQYYHEPGHEHEMQIDLPPGSYVPEFRRSGRHTGASLPLGRIAYPVAAAVLAAALGVAAWVRPWESPSAFDRFWKPILDAASPVLLCVGEAQSLQSSTDADGETAPEPQADRHVGLYAATVGDLHRMESQHVAISDAITLARLATLLRTKRTMYRIQSPAATTFSELRAGPVVLVGAFNNSWTLRLTGHLRFSFERDPDGDMFWIKDRENPSRKDWSVNYSLPHSNLREDFAIVARVLDPATERMAVIAAGITKYGTVAAGEFLSEPSYLEAIQAQAPGDWERKNIEAVIVTQVIGGSSGPPRVAALHVW